MKAVIQLVVERRVWLYSTSSSTGTWLTKETRQRHRHAEVLRRKQSTHVRKPPCTSTVPIPVPESYLIKSPSPTLAAKRVLKLPSNQSPSKLRISEACHSRHCRFPFLPLEVSNSQRSATKQCIPRGSEKKYGHEILALGQNMAQAI